MAPNTSRAPRQLPPTTGPDKPLDRVLGGPDSMVREGLRAGRASGILILAATDQAPEVMMFDHHSQADLYARVEGYLRQGFADLVEVVEDEPAFFVGVRGRSFLVTVSANGPDTAVTVYTMVADWLAVTPASARFLLRCSHDQMPFGAVGLREDDQIAVHHVLFGETVTATTLLALLTTLAESCEELEDELDARFRSRQPGPRPVP